MVKDKNENKLNKESKSDKYLFDLVVASLEGNVSRAEMISLNIARSLTKENPSLSQKLKEVLGIYSMRGSAGMRGVDSMPLPVDNDTHLEMVTIVSPKLESDTIPILPELTHNRIESFLEERRKVLLLLEKNIRPSNSLLLIGKSGTGKTMLAHYIASSLKKNLIVLDLSSSISSLLGKTGHNLKRVLQYAKQTASVLLLDEFDAIAKRRDDNTDLGEMKRIVNVLLMELEDWPTSSVLIATSNHPELLDKAIWRRFDHTIEVPMPELRERELLLARELGEYFEKSVEKNPFLYILAELLNGVSAADVCKFSNNVKRRIVLKKEDPLLSCFHELELFVSDKKIRGKICKLAKEKLKLTVREIAKITGLSPAGVQHHLKQKQ